MILQRNLLDQDQNRDLRHSRNLLADFTGEIRQRPEDIEGNFREPNQSGDETDNNSNQNNSDFKNPDMYRAMSDPDPVHLFLGANVELLTTDRTVEDISLASKQFPKDKREELKRTDMKS